MSVRMHVLSKHKYEPSCHTLGNNPTPKVLIANDRLEEARKVLDTAMAAPGIRAPLSQEQRDRLSKKGLEPSAHERASVFLLLAEVHQKLWTQKRQPQPQDQALGQQQGLGALRAAHAVRAGAAAGVQAACESPEARKVRAIAAELVSDAVCGWMDALGEGRQSRSMLPTCPCSSGRRHGVLKPELPCTDHTTWAETRCLLALDRSCSQRP